MDFIGICLLYFSIGLSVLDIFNWNEYRADFVVHSLTLIVGGYFIFILLGLLAALFGNYIWLAFLAAITIINMLLNE